MQTYHIHINGIVQGVGFRPMVYLLAKEMEINGYVKNSVDGVHVYFNDNGEQADLFYSKIIKDKPQQSKIISSKISIANPEIFNDFLIEHDKVESCKRQVLVSPDTATCSDCRNELHNSNNRRFRYLFITCTQCGPRYSIIESLPYERHATAMQKFSMCKSCSDEYDEVTDRRFFSQTNSCKDCGIRLSILENASTVLSDNSEEVLSNTMNFLQQGKIIAIKGVGGYLLLCDANNPDAIQKLRTRKHRPSKPFAVLYPSMACVENDFYLNEKVKALLENTEAPITLLFPKETTANNVAIQDIAPHLKRLGIMLPYSPLLDLIANDFGKPLVATSANISGSPIIYKDEDALNFLFEIADYIVSYNREIIIPQDDSVVYVSSHFNRQIFLRRSRGYAPSFLHYKPKKEECVLSTGAFLKSSFTLSVNGNVFVSQFLGSGESYESQKMYKDTLGHWLKLYNVQPGIILADKHPGYFSHQYAVELSEKYKIRIDFIQHHKAHFAAVLAENNLIEPGEPVLGVIWDGTGLGDDGNIWGGEFFKYKNKEMQHYCHFDYFPVIAGDKMAIEPRLSAICTTAGIRKYPEIIKEKFTKSEWHNYQSLINTTNLFSSSVGRLFDAVASMLGICDKQSYEGEAAMYLQVLAEDYVEENGFIMDDSYFSNDAAFCNVPTASLMQGIITDIETGKSKNYIAAKFHYSLVWLIGAVAEYMGLKKSVSVVAFFKTVY